jgi:hypothetical protein
MKQNDDDGETAKDNTDGDKDEVNKDRCSR